MELNAENIINEIQSLIKALKDCGGWVERGNGEGWFNHEILADALALITSQEQDKEKLGLLIDEIEKEKRELWEERNRIYDDLQDWKAIAEQYQKQFEDCAEDRAKLTEENERLRAEEKQSQILIETLHDKLDEGYAKFVDEERADTVREMQERLDKHFCHDPAFLGVEQRLIMDIIDQIAKEMLEGTNED